MTHKEKTTIAKNLLNAYLTLHDQPYDEFDFGSDEANKQYINNIDEALKLILDASLSLDKNVYQKWHKIVTESFIERQEKAIISHKEQNA